MTGTDKNRIAPWAIVWLAATVIAVVALIVSKPRPNDPRPRAVSNWPPRLDAHAARTMLDSLAVVRLAPEIAYDRVRDFGPPWADMDHNGCDTRDDILRRDLRAERVATSHDPCVILAGVLDDPYTAEQIVFSKSDPTAVQIDHLVPLHAAWQLGAWRWTSTTRAHFANDPRELLAVEGNANQQKGDALADRWRPANRSIWCAYAANTIDVHAAYGLGVTRAERDALSGMLDTC